MAGFLEDIRQLSERGDTTAALELIDLWLGEHPSDGEARLIKADLCLAQKQNYEYIGRLLLDSTGEESEALDLLRKRSAELAWKLVDEGRDRLRSRYPGQALEYFDQAVALLPTDPVVALAAGLALTRIAPTPDSAVPASPFDDTRRWLNPARRAAAVEKYLRRVIDAAAPDQRPYEVAVTALVKQWLTQDDLAADALPLLLRIPQPAPATLDLLAEVKRRVVTLMLDTIGNLLRIGLPEKADRLLAVCGAHLHSAPLLILQAECLSTAEAFAAYAQALEIAEQPEFSGDAARTLLLAAQGVQVKCPHCGKLIRPNISTCVFCDTSLLQKSLLSDRYPGAPTAVLARIGMAETLAEQGQTEAALVHWQASVEMLSQDHRAFEPLSRLHDRLVGISSGVVSPILQLLSSLNERGVISEVLERIRQINQTKPSEWLTLPAAKRALVVRRLIAGEYFTLAEQTLSAAFADQPGRKSAAALRALLDDTLRAKVDAALVIIEQLMIAGGDELAASRATHTLALYPDARLYIARGQAHLAMGNDLAALDDFYMAQTSARHPADRSAACKAAAGVLERRWNLSGARVLLETLDPHDPEVESMLARLDRRERGEPFILIEQVTDGVTEDGLTRRPVGPYSHATFSLVVRAVSVGNENRESWVRKILSAQADFVQVLGALRDVMGDAVFVLRTISQPHETIPERGTITVALLARVSADDEANCRARALQLWTDLYAMLPLAQENIYSYEPVVDQAELRRLLGPFELAHTAEIIHHQSESGGVALVNPFVPGSLDLHTLHSVLLRQPAPAMLSLHLKPTHLLPWERSSAASAPRGDAPNDPPLPDALTSANADHIQRQIARVQLWQQLQTDQAHLQNLQSAYVLRANIAGSAGTSQLLPEMVAAALFEPLSLSEGAAQGGYEIVRPGTQPEFDIIARNLASLDVESWLLNAERFRFLVGEREAAQIFRLPIPSAEGVPGMTLLEGRAVIPPARMPENGIRLGMSVARIRGVPLPITQAEPDRRRHLYLVGKTGMGKSTLLMNLVLQDIEAGRGVFLLDPHGDLCDDVLERVPAHRADDVILLDPSDAERPIGLNILDAETEADQQRVINEFIGLLARLYDPHQQAIVGPIFQQSVRNAMLAAMSLPDGTLVDVYRLLSDPQYVKRVLPHVKDPLVRHYWDDLSVKMSGASDHWKAELLPYLLSKFSRFVEDSTLRRMIGQPRTSIPYKQVMDEGKILLVNLAKGRIGQENAQFIGSLALSSMLQAAFQRGEQPASRRREFYVYIDEVQNYATPLLATMLSEGRKFGVILTIANQFLHQLDGGIREAVFGNVGSLVAFRVGTQDAPVLATEMYPTFSANDLLNLPQFTTVTKLLIDGVAARPFTMRTLPALLPADATRAAQIREQSRQNYGTDIQTVQAEIFKKF